MLDHAGFGVSDYQRSRSFYEQALAPLGIEVVMELADRQVLFGRGGKPFFVVGVRYPPAKGAVHIAFAAEDRASVDAFHAAGLAAGGTDNGAPGVREVYHPNYYGAFVLDPDANNIEAVCHKPA
jgi:catechol 2,3-dioxygenase-like lactoylglutathione lyase family enzyme